MNSLKLVVAFCALLGLAYADGEGPKPGFGGLDQDWDMVNIRKGAYMFWWLHYTQADVVNATERPLILWLQGGPGASSTGYGNFEEIGPFDIDMVRREFTWINDFNVLFIDNPVGAGFSYVDDVKYLATNNRQIAIDLVLTLWEFYDRLPEFKDVPFHIMSESYGGKMAAELALLLHRGIQAETIECNLVSVGLIDSWISPIDSVMAWSPYLEQMGFVDVDGYEEIEKNSYMIKLAVATEQWEEAAALWNVAMNVFQRETHGVDVYNVLFKMADNAQSQSSLVDSIDSPERDAKLELLMTQVHQTLELPDHIVWGSQRSLVRAALAGDFMRPVTHIVEELLEKTDIEVVVITGAMDLICATPGTVKWVNNLTWSGAYKYKAASREAVSVNGVIEGYSREEDNFSMYWILRSGHMVPYDNPTAMRYILKQLTGY